MFEKRYVKTFSIKSISFLLLTVFLVNFTVAFSNDSQTPSPPKKTSILATFFPIYLFTQNIISGIDNLEIELLLPAAYGCPHDFSLSPGDIKKIYEADIIVMNGLGMENFLQKTLNSGNKSANVINASEDIIPIKLKYEETHTGHSEGSIAFNPHSFVSPKQAALMVDKIMQGLVDLLPQYADQLRANGNKYQSILEKLSQAFADSLINLRRPKIVTVHEVLEYLARDYHFEVSAVIEREPGQEPSAREMLKLVELIRPLDIAGFFSEPQYSPKIVETLGNEIGKPVYLFDPIAGAPSEVVPLDYYEKVMTNNLAILCKAMK
jgi:zinc transport system substrate-binding protein